MTIKKMKKQKCGRCGDKAEVEIEGGFYLCSGCECVYNNILNEPLEERTLRDFFKELKGGKKQRWN